MSHKRTLSKDIHLLGDTLGEIIRNHSGEHVFAQVEAMRGLAKDARDATLPLLRSRARDQLATIADSLNAADALEIARAFTLYFQLVNQAEDVHRTRILRKRAASCEEVDLEESLPALVRELEKRGATLEETLNYLDELSLSFVFTAHPTEARRRTTEKLLMQIRIALESFDRHEQTPRESRRLKRRIRANIESLWLHASERRQKPEVIDEVRAGLWYFEHVLFDSVARIQRRLHVALSEAYGEVEYLRIPSPIRFGSWMGADRDGNPFVSAEITDRTLEMHREAILNRYLDDLRELIDPMAALESRLKDLKPVHNALATIREHAPNLDLTHNDDEPLRQYVSLMRARIEATKADAERNYINAGDFLKDLHTLYELCVTNGAKTLAEDRLVDIIVRARTFGFHLASLDIREDSRMHRKVIAELLNSSEYADDIDRETKLTQLSLPGDRTSLSDEAKRLLALFEGLAKQQSRFGARAIHTYIVSMCQVPADLLEPIRLAELHGCEKECDFAPLFETKEALDNAAKTLTSLFENKTYRAHLESRGNVQEIVLGYSDSMKENGIFASRVAVLEAQFAIAETCKKFGIKSRIFHGRGGSVSRGGGPTYRAIRALPAQSFDGQIKITEQGEVRAFHFANPDLSARYLEQTLGATLALRFEKERDQQEWSAVRPQLREMAELGRAKYRELIDDSAMIDYFQTATPFSEIASLNIGSRPAKRRSGALDLSGLRAIPWVFGWSQCRQVITGWLGVGSATEHSDLASLRDIYQKSPFFRDLIENVEMAMAKSDLAIGRRYAQLLENEHDRHRLLSLIEEEFDRSTLRVLEICDAPQLLHDQDAIRHSIALRNPYVDPLSYIQVAALRAKQAKRDADEWSKVARITVQGIAAGLRNTG